MVDGEGLACGVMVTPMTMVEENGGAARAAIVGGSKELGRITKVLEKLVANFCVCVCVCAVWLRLKHDIFIYIKGEVCADWGHCELNLCLSICF